MRGRTPRRAAAAVEGARAQTLARLEERSWRDTAKGRAFYALVLLGALIGIAGLVTLIVQALVNGLPRLNLDLITKPPSGIPEDAGLRPAIIGSLMVMAGVLAIVVPVGVGAALYLEEYASRERWWVRVIELNIQNLAAVPSIVFGILGLAYIVRGPLSLGFIAFAGSLTLALLVLPTVILASREAIRAVPPSIREAGFALGATKWQTIRHQVLPASIPGVATGTILAMARAIGETAPLLLVGATVFVSFNPQSPFSADGYTVVPVQIFNWVTRPQDEFRVLAAASIIVLIAVLLVMNSFAIWLRNRYRKKMQW
jgi:phosphate transport system permease protein